jgi:hypothetical protein
MRGASVSTKSSETNLHDLARFGTQTSIQTIGTNGASLSTLSFFDQIPEALQEEGRTDNNEEKGGERGEEEEEEEEQQEVRVVADPRARRKKAAGTSGSKEPDMLQVKDSSGPRRSPFRPSPESWANATAEALAHLEATGVIPQVPEIPHFARTPPPLNTTNGVTSSPSVSSRDAAEADVDISASSPFKQVAPGVSLYSPGTTPRTSFIPPAKRSQSSKSVKHNLPEPLSPAASDRSTELPYRRTREKRRTNQNRNVVVYSPTASSEYLAEHEDDDRQKPPPSKVPSQPYRDESDGEHSTTGQVDPRGDLPRYTARSSSTSGSITLAPTRPLRLSAARARERRGSRTSDDTVLDIARYDFPDAPPHQLVRPPSASQNIPQNRRREDPVAVMEGGAQQPRREYERHRDDYSLSPPPYGSTQSPGRAPIIDSGAYYRYRVPRYRVEREFPSAPRDDPTAYRMSSSLPPRSASALGLPYRAQSPRASSATRVRPGEDRSVRPSPPPSEFRPLSPEIARTRTRNHYGGATTDRETGPIPEGAPQGRRPSSSGHASDIDRRPAAKDAGHYHPRGFQSRQRSSSSPRESSVPPPPVPPIPISHRPDEHGSRYGSTLEPGHFRAGEDQYPSKYSPHPSMRSPSMRSSIMTSIATPYDETSAASILRSPSQLSTVYDSQDELFQDRKVKMAFVAVRAHRAEDDRPSYSSILGEYQYDEKDSIPDLGLLKERGRGDVLEAVEALNSVRPRTPVSNHLPNITNSTTPMYKKQVNGIEESPTVVIPPVMPTKSLKMPAAEEEAPLHADELAVLPPKPLSRMEKALLRRVEFGSNVDHSKIRLA